MSGVELTLAVLPLIITAAEHHREVIRIGKNLTSNKAKNEQQLDFYYELYDELALLENTLRGIVRGLPSRVNNTGFFPLTEDDHEEINTVLGSSAAPFQDILKRLLKSLEALVSDKSLDLAKSALHHQSPEKLFQKLEHFKRQIDGGETTKSLRNRFQFTRNEKSRTIALLRIREANVKLERLLRGSLLPGNNEFRRVGTKKPHSTRLRRLSEPLFNKIARKWPTACECHSQHEARLCLWNCCSNQRIQRSSDSLDMLVSVTDVKNDGSPWQESTILVREHHGPTPPNPTVRFAGNEGEPPNSLASNIPGRDIDSESLCRLIHQAHGQQSTLQIIFDQNKLWQIQSRKRKLALHKQKDITLKDLLDGPCPNIKLKEKWTLAVTLAHAALHCSDGPWLCEDWSKEHITFFSCDSSMVPDLSHPCLKVCFEDDSKDTDVACSLLNPHSNPALLSLGILLLEIYLNGPIESRWAEEDLIEGKPNENTNLTTALRLLQDAEGDLYEGYRAAIQACLECETQGLDADNLRQKVYKEIVWPLEQELEHGFHIRPEDL